MGIKSGARHSAGDQKMVQVLHDTARDLGADCASGSKHARAGAVKGAGGKAMSDAPGLRGYMARACGSCNFYKPVEGDWDEGLCTKYDFAPPGDLVCDAWEAVPAQPLQVVVVSDRGTEMLSADNPPPLVVPAYVKALHLPHDEQFLRDVLAVKFIGKDDLRGYAVLWGDPQRVDLETEFFTPQTDFWKSALGMPRPLTWNHAQDKAAFRAHPVIGKMMELGEDAVGMFYNAVLDRAHEYSRAVEGLIQKRVVGTSSDSAPQYVERQKMANGSVWLKTWPLLAAALTDVPCEPRMIAEGNVYWKSVGVDLSAMHGRNAEAPGVQARVTLEQRMADASRHHDLLTHYLEV